MTELPFSVLSWNLYLGADISRVIAADPSLVPSRMTTIWETVKRTNFPARAKAIARIICREQPDAVALQEVYRWSRISRCPLGEGMPSEHREYDFLSILLDELKAHGETYFTAVRSAGVNIALPAAREFDVRLEDSVVLLLRAGHGTGGLTWARPRSGRFATNLRTTVDGEPFGINRGWASIDLCRDGHTIRIVTTHLEFFSSDVQPAQLREILDGPASVSGPVILAGDFNGRPGSQTWQKLTQSGFVDVWEAGGTGPGYTSSQDEDLRNPESALYERVDWIMCRGPVEIVRASLLGLKTCDRTADGLWPSDHAGVLAKLAIRPNGPSRKPCEGKTEVQQPMEPVEVVKAAFDRFIAKDISSLMDLVDPDSEWSFPGNPDILPWARTYRGAGLMRFFLACAESLEYLEYNVHSVYGQHDIVTVLSSERCRVRKTGKVFLNHIASIIRVANGKIVHYVEYADTATMHAAFELR